MTMEILWSVFTPIAAMIAEIEGISNFCVTQKARLSAIGIKDYVINYEYDIGSKRTSIIALYLDNRQNLVYFLSVLVSIFGSFHSSLRMLYL